MYTLGLQSYKNILNIKSGHLMLVTAFLLPFSVSLSSIAFFAMLALSLVEGDIKQKALSFWTSQFTKVFLTGFLMVAFAVSYSTSSWHDSLYVVKKYLWLLLTPVLLATLDVKPAKRYFFDVLLAAIVLMVIASYLNYFFHFDFSPHSRITTFFQDRIKHGYLALIGIVLVINNMRLKRYVILNGALFAGLVVNLFYINDARTGYVLLPIILVTTLFFGIKSKKVMAGILLSIPLAFLLLSINTLGQYSVQRAIHDIKEYKVNHVSRTSLGIRADQWYYGVRGWLLKPMIGYGTGSPGKIINTMQSKISGDKLHGSDTPALVDCGIVNIFVQWGIVGSAYFLYLLYFLCNQSRMLEPSHQLIFICLLLLNTVGSLFNNWLATSIPTHMFVLLIVYCFPSLLKGRL